MSSNSEPEFYYQDLDEDNIADLLQVLRDQPGEVVGIVDENQGGIIAYALSRRFADEIVYALSRTY